MNNIVNNIWEEEHSSKRRVCMLMITHACNLKCSYCYETHKQNVYMTIDLAKDIILKEAKMIEKVINLMKFKLILWVVSPL